MRQAQVASLSQPNKHGATYKDQIIPSAISAIVALAIALPAGTLFGDSPSKVSAATAQAGQATACAAPAGAGAVAGTQTAAISNEAVHSTHKFVHTVKGPGGSGGTNTSTSNSNNNNSGAQTNGNTGINTGGLVGGANVFSSVNALNNNLNNNDILSGNNVGVSALNNPTVNTNVLNDLVDSAVATVVGIKL